MTALSILEMNRTMVAREYAMDDYLKTLPRNTEPVYYWQIFRRSKAARKDRQWVFVKNFYGTKADVAEHWNKWFRDGQHRLKCVLKYPTRSS